MALRATGAVARAGAGAVPSSARPANPGPSPSSQPRSHGAIQIQNPKSKIQNQESQIQSPALFLAALQLADSFFPSGLYTQSHGLESFVAAGAVGPGAIEPLLHSYLRHAAGPADALAARLACRAALAGDLARAAAVDARLEATRLSAEGRAASRRCGGRVLLLTADLYGDERLRAYRLLVAERRAPGHQAVAMALAAAAAGLGEEEAALVELHTFAVSLVGAAVRLGALEHTAAQALLLRAQPVMQAAAAAHAGRGEQDIGGFAPQVDVMQLRHRYALDHMFVS